MCETSTERVSRLAPGELQRVRDDGVEPVWELVPLRAARPALAVAHVVPRVYRYVLLDQRLVQLFEPPQMLVYPVRPEHHRGGGGRDFGPQPVGAQSVGEPSLGADAHAPVRLAREAPLLHARHGGALGRLTRVEPRSGNIKRACVETQSMTKRRKSETGREVPDAPRL